MNEIIYLRAKSSLAVEVALEEIAVRGGGNDTFTL